MTVQHKEFHGRVARLQTKHAAFSRGYTARVQSDGLIIVEPRRLRSRVSGRVFLLILTGFLIFKAFLMAAVGFASYDERVNKLASGTMIEKLGAVLMQADPVSTWGAQKMGPILR
ncbi:hypothetical protein [Pseudophaeobacter profundi]|jgi:hypothetical protein|uniref:hypothetical protein n=1 Tax=Pseudophaeobacter profundi TaxID=3034152 RepID=UPI00242E8D18|nr:hypothetical protein [Pseudophaeobacter profundi]